MRLAVVVKMVSTESSTQTTEYSASEKGTNTLDKSSIEVQTVTEETIEKNVDVDMQKLADWLSKIYPKVKKEIDEANNSRAFQGYRLAEELCEANCKILQTINVSKATEGDSRLLKVSVMSWNQTGKSLALTCSYEHKSWCYHPGTVLVYVLNRYKIKAPLFGGAQRNTEASSDAIKRDSRGVVCFDFSSTCLINSLSVPKGVWLYSALRWGPTNLEVVNSDNSLDFE
ncbi:hypothetical protein NQ318_012828 [Aromia moschata]|uniref:Uncharacterized protein n=1 Tax=Aromia moschata TaxID=1265417 RepID=A0AAV8XB69_9CUCU|nr:hypothetical protein NQ318_012828 [Aromia moschata]